MDPDSRRLLCAFDEAGELVLSLGMASTVARPDCTWMPKAASTLRTHGTARSLARNNEGRALYMIPPGAP
ncbi:MAG: hypothetical protein R3F17_14705 [Planctomycetota bacterium]